MKFICALLVVDDMEKSKAFYTGVLGLKILSDFGENVTFEGPFALHLKKHYRGLIGNLDIKSSANNSELYFEEDDLEKLQNELKARGAEFVHEIREQPWKQRVLRIYDPSKNIIEIGESLEFTAYRLWKEGMKEEEIGRVLYMGTEFVKEAIRKFEQ